jgi:hypothetical protein
MTGVKKHPCKYCFYTQDLAGSENFLKIENEKLKEVSDIARNQIESDFAQREKTTDVSILYNNVVRVLKNRLKYDLKSNQIICQKCDLKSQSNGHFPK